MRSGGRGRRLADRMLSVVAVLGALCIAFAVLSALFGIRPLVFRSGSMSPTITTGSLALARSVEAPGLHVGDIVSVPLGGTRVTHRIASIDRHGERASLTLRGDANPVADARPYDVARADRVFLHVPTVGYVVSFLSGPVGVFLGGMLAALLLWLVLRPARGRDRDHRAGDPPRGQPRGQHRSGVAVVIALVVLLLGGSGLAPGLGATPTWAWWTDEARVAVAASAYDVPEPSGSVSCANGQAGSETVTLSWPLTTSPSGYRRYQIQASWSYWFSTYYSSKIVTANDPYLLHESDLGLQWDFSGTITVRIWAITSTGGWISVGSLSRTVYTDLFGFRCS